MAEKEKKDEKMVVVFNGSGRSYTTSMGPLEMGASLAVPESEAKDLLDYHGVKDASKMAKAVADVTSDSLQKDNNKLSKANEKLATELEAAHEENEKLRSQLNDAKAELAGKKPAGDGGLESALSGKGNKK